jgi:hypothetical protein
VLTTFASRLNSYSLSTGAIDMWIEPTAGIGSNIDSVYEYYLKQYILFGDDASFDLFLDLYHSAVDSLLVKGRW